MQKFINFNNKIYKWGYFLKVTLDFEKELYVDRNTAELLWVARMIDWKHLEYIDFAVRLLDCQGIDYTIDIAGARPLEETMRNMLARNEIVRFLSAIPNKCVQELMKRSDVFIFTSDRNEGWVWF